MYIQIIIETSNKIYFETFRYSGSEVESFDEVLYRGTLNNGNVTHETITLSEYKGTEILLTGGK